MDSKFNRGTNPPENASAPNSGSPWQQPSGGGGGGGGQPGLPSPPPLPPLPPGLNDLQRQAEDFLNDLDAAIQGRR